MSTPHRFAYDAGQVDALNDPGVSGKFAINGRSLVRIEMTSVGAAEARELPLPSSAGQIVTLIHAVDGGDIDLTVISGFDAGGDTTMNTTTAGDFVTFISIAIAASTYRWRLLGFEGFTGLTEVQSGNQTIDGTLAVTGATTLSSTLAVTGAATLSATLTAVGIRPTSATAAAIAANRTLTVADSGGIFTVAKTGVYTITLPVPAQGLNFKFLVIDTGANIVTILATGAICFGMLTEAGATPTVMTGTTILATSGQVIGDWLQVEGIDATHWLVTGSTLVAASFTIS